jgi:hypothetical protein
MYRSLALELYRPSIDRYVPIVGVLYFVGIFWAAAMNSYDGSLITHEFAG